jgi:hypothetical protein
VIWDKKEGREREKGKERERKVRGTEEGEKRGGERE